MPSRGFSRASTRDTHAKAPRLNEPTYPAPDRPARPGGLPRPNGVESRRPQPRRPCISSPAASSLSHRPCCSAPPPPPSSPRSRGRNGRRPRRPPTPPPAARTRRPPPRTPSPGSSRASRDRKSTRLNSSHSQISYAVFCLKKKKQKKTLTYEIPTTPVQRTRITTNE